MKCISAILLLIGIVIGCSSCGGLCRRTIEFGEKNFDWYFDSYDTVLLHANAYHFKSEGKIWAVLNWHGKGQLDGQDIVVFLCLSQNGDMGAYKLLDGFAVWTDYVLPAGDNQIIRCAKLNTCRFFGEILSGNVVSLKYNGEISSKEVLGYSSRPLAWMQFHIKSYEDINKVINTIKKNYALLKKEPDAKEILLCLEPLLAVKSSN